MRKLKLLMAACALVGSVAVGWAQTDVTSTYITNADFEGTYSVLSYPNQKKDRAIYQPSGWNVTRTGNDSNDMTILTSSDLASNNFTAFTINDAETRGNQTYWTRLRWGTNTGLKLSQKKTLDPGYYTLTALVLNYNNNIDANKTEIFAGTNSVTASKSNTKNDGAGWKTLTVNFTINDATETEIGFKLTHATEKNGNNDAGEQIVGVDNFRLTYTDFKAELRAVIAQAQAINARISTLTDDITTAQSVLNTSSSSKTAIDDAVTTLRSAITEKLAAYKGLDAAGDDITSFIVNNGFETSPTFDGTSLGASGASGTNATPTVGSTLLYNSANVYQINGWELLTTEISDFARTFTMPYNTTLYVKSNNAAGGQAVAAPTNGSSVATDNNSLLFVEANWCQNAVLGVKQVLPLPAGSYRLTFDSYVTTSVDNAESLCGISYGETKDYKWPTAKDTWNNNEIDFTLDEQTNVTISMGYKKINNVGGDRSAFLFVDNVKLTYFDPLKLAQIQWQEVHDALAALDATALPDAAESAITTELAKDVPTTSADDVNTAKAALQALIDSYAGIKAAYDKVLDHIAFVTDEKNNSTGTKTDIETAIGNAITNIEERTIASDLENDYNTLEEARQTYVTSGAQPTEEHEFDFTFKITDATVTDKSKWDNVKTASGQQYNGAPDNTYMDCGWKSNAHGRQTVNLPAGYYNLKAATRAMTSDVTSANIYVNQTRSEFNRSTNINGIGNTGGELGNGWNWSEVNFELRADGDVTVGFYAQTTGQGWAGADDFHLYYKGNAVADDAVDALIATMVEGKMEATVATAQTNAKNQLQSNKTIENYDALEAAIAEAATSKANYASLKENLDKIPAVVATTNVYTNDAYKENYTDVLTGYNNGTITTAAAGEYTFGERVTGAMPAIMLSAWKVGETAALTDASLYMNTWSTEGNTDGSDVTTPFYEYFVDKASQLSAKTFTATVEGLTAGTGYQVSIRVRVRQQNDQVKADNGITLQVNEGEEVNCANGDQSSLRPEMYYKTVKATGTADKDGKLSIKISVKEDNHISWLAFKNVNYSEVVAPTEEHKTALATAISTANDKTLGFDADEYAPYNNAAARRLLAAAKDIDVTSATDAEVVAATNELNGAEWSQNDGEVNAVSSELFNGVEYLAAGWTHNVGWSNVGNDGSYSIPAGTMTYGTIAYHEMPLKAETIYTLSFGHRKWDNDNPDNGGTVSVLNENSDGLAATSYTGTSATTLQTETIDFLTGDAGNYTFTISAASGRLTFGNVTIKQAVAKPITISEEAKSAPVFWFANATLTRTLSASYWNTFSVPFDMKIPDGWTVKEFKSAEENVITFGNAESIKAGKPYLVKPTENVVNPTFSGVVVENTEGETVGDGDYKFAAQIYNKDLDTNGTIAYLATDGKVKKLTSGGIKGLRAYFIIPKSGESARIAFIDDDEQTTGINEMKSQPVEDGNIYDLNGRRVQTMKKGIYVVNGKKIVK